MFLLSYKVTPNFAPLVRLGAVHNAPGAGDSGTAFVNPVIGLVLGVWLGGEAVSAMEWSAAGIVMAGVVLLLVSRRA